MMPLDIMGENLPPWGSLGADDKAAEIVLRKRMAPAGDAVMLELVQLLGHAILIVTSQPLASHALTKQ